MAWGVDEAWDVQWSPHVSWVSKLKTHMLVTLVMLVIHETVFGVSIFWSNTMVFEISQNKTRNMGSEFDDEFGSSKTDNRLGHVRAAKVGVCGDSQPVPTCQVVSPQNTGGYGLFCLPAPRGSWAHLGLCSCHRQSVDRPKLSPPQSAWPHVTTLSLPRDTTKQTHSHLQLSLAAGLQLQCCLHLEAHKVEWSLLDLEDVCQVRQAPGIIARRTPLSKETWSLTKLSATWPLTRLLSMAWIEGYIAEQILWAKHQHKNTCSSALSSEQILVIFTLYVRRSKLNSCGEVMASLHKAPYRYTQSQHPFHQLGRIAARRGGSRWGIGFLFPLRWYLQGNSNFYLITKADVDSFS